MSQSRCAPTLSGKSSRVRPVRSPIMCISTAATTLVRARRAGRRPPRARATLTSRHADHDRAVGHLRQRGGRVTGADVGHLAQRVELQLLQVRTSSMRVLPTARAAGVEDQRRGAVAEDRRSADDGGIPRGASNGFDHDLLLARAARPPPARCGARPPPGSPPAAGPARRRRRRRRASRRCTSRDHLLAHHQHLAAFAAAVTGARIELHRLRHVGQRHRVALAADVAPAARARSPA